MRGFGIRIVLLLSLSMSCKCLAEGPSEQVTSTTDQSLQSVPGAAKGTAAALEDPLRRARELGERGEFKSAILLCDKAINSDSRSASAYEYRGWCHEQTGNHQQALRDYSAALALEPARATVFENCGHTYQELGEHQNAIRQFDRAIKLNPDNAVAFAGRALSYQKLGQHRKALDDFDQSLRIDPKYGPAYKGRELSFRQLREHNREVASMTGAVAKSAVRASSRDEAKGAPEDETERDAAPSRDELDGLPDEDTFSFTKTKSGHPIVKAEINGRSLDMMFDTGANFCAIGGNHLKSIGIDPGALKGKTQLCGGSGGGVVAVKVVPLTIKLGKTTRTVDFFLQPEMPTAPLVGHNFVLGFQYEMNNQLQIVRLRKQGAGRTASAAAAARIDPRDRNAVPFVMSGKSIVVPVEVCGKEVPMVFDTGCDGIAFPARVWQQLNLPNAKLVGTGMARGIDGVTPCYMYKVDRIDFGPVSLKDVPVTVSVPGPSLPLLGQRVLGTEKFVIDETSHVIRFHR